MEFPRDPPCIRNFCSVAKMLVPDGPPNFYPFRELRLMSGLLEFTMDLMCVHIIYIYIYIYSHIAHILHAYLYSCSAYI